MKHLREALPSELDSLLPARKWVPDPRIARVRIALGAAGWNCGPQRLKLREGQLPLMAAIEQRESADSR